MKFIAFNIEINNTPLKFLKLKQFHFSLFIFTLIYTLFQINYAASVSSSMKRLSKNRKDDLLASQGQTNSTGDLSLRSFHDKMSDIFHSTLCYVVSPEDALIARSAKSKLSNQKNHTVIDLPDIKSNKYELKKIGFEKSAYLFDFLDAALEQPIMLALQKLWDSAFANKIEETYDLKNRKSENFNPYALQFLFKSNETDKFLICEIKKIRKNFNEKIYNESITLPQFRSAAKTWTYHKNKNDPLKFIFDQHDLNGDGRLSRKEFILAFLETHKTTLGEPACIEQPCIHSVIRDYVSVMFERIDCKDNEKVNAEEIWEGVKSLKRFIRDDKGALTNEKQNNFDMYQCEANGVKVHTNSVSDFVIKSQKTFTGYLDKTEFVRGIMLGYWNRNVDDLKFYLDSEKLENLKESKSNKELRWNDNGVDIMCY